MVGYSPLPSLSSLKPEQAMDDDDDKEMLYIAEEFSTLYHFFEYVQCKLNSALDPATGKDVTWFI